MMASAAMQHHYRHHHEASGGHNHHQTGEQTDSTTHKHHLFVSGSTSDALSPLHPHNQQQQHQNQNYPLTYQVPTLRFSTAATAASSSSPTTMKDENQSTFPSHQSEHRAVDQTTSTNIDLYYQNQHTTESSSVTNQDHISINSQHQHSNSQQQALAVNCYPHAYETSAAAAHLYQPSSGANYFAGHQQQYENTHPHLLNHQHSTTAAEYSSFIHSFSQHQNQQQADYNPGTFMYLNGSDADQHHLLVLQQRQQQQQHHHHLHHPDHHHHQAMMYNSQHAAVDSRQIETVERGQSVIASDQRESSEEHVGYSSRGIPSLRSINNKQDQQVAEQRTVLTELSASRATSPSKSTAISGRRSQFKRDPDENKADKQQPSSLSGRKKKETIDEYEHHEGRDELSLRSDRGYTNPSSAYLSQQQLDTNKRQSGASWREGNLQLAGREQESLIDVDSRASHKFKRQNFPLQVPESPVEVLGANQPLSRCYATSARTNYDPTTTCLPDFDDDVKLTSSSSPQLSVSQEKSGSDNNNGPSSTSANEQYSQLRILEMRKEKSRDAARSRRSKENHEFYELAKLLPLPAAITSQLDFLDKASIIRLTISFLKLRQFSVNGYPPWAPDFTTLGSINPYSSHSLTDYAELCTSGNQSEESQTRPTSAAIGSVKPIKNSSSNNNHSITFNSSNNSHDGDDGITTSTIGRRLEFAPNPMLPSSVAFPNIAPIEQFNTSANCNQEVLNSSSSLSNINDKLNNNLVKNTASLFDIHQGTHILQSLDGFAFAIGRDGRFLYISETVSMYLGLSQVEMTGSSVFDYTHQQDHEELAKQLGLPYFTMNDCNSDGVNQSANTATRGACGGIESPPPDSVRSQYSSASNETAIDDYVNSVCPPRKRAKAQTTITTSARGAYGRQGKRLNLSRQLSAIKGETTPGNVINLIPSVTPLTTIGNDGALSPELKPVPTNDHGRGTSNTKSDAAQGTDGDPLVRQFCIRMKSTLTKRGCQHFKSSGYRVVHVVAHLRSYQSNDHGHLMDPLDDPSAGQASSGQAQSGSRQAKRRGPKQTSGRESSSGISKELDKRMGEHNGASITSDITSSSTVDAQKLGAPRHKIIGMVAVAIALPPPSINELRLESDTFVLRLGLDLRITHIEPKITELLHYPVELIAGKSLYSLVHPADVHQVQKCHRELLRKGQMMSGYYRLLARNGGYIWIQTCATLICNTTLNSGQGGSSALPSSPMPSLSNPNSIQANSSSANQLYPTEHQLQGKLPNNTNYLNPPMIPTKSDSSANYNSNNHYNTSSLGNLSKMASPSLSSSHLSNSNYDNLDQDQCVIFVNYMITNVIETGCIVDICQSQNYTPLSSFSGSTTNNNSSSSVSGTNNNHIFNSPSSSCSSPFLSSLKTNISCGSNHASPATPDSNVSLPAIALASNVSPSATRRHQNPSESKTSRELKATNGGRRSGIGKQQTKPHQSLQLDHQQQQQQHHHHHHHSQPVRPITSASTSIAAAYGNSDEAATQHHHYSTVNRSIYNAAFGLDVNTAAWNHHYNHHHHHQQASVYPANAGNSYNGQTASNWDSTSALAAATNSWDGSGAATGSSSVAAGSGSTGNSWESTSAAAAAAAAAASAHNYHHPHHHHHHPYYNYYYT